MNKRIVIKILSLLTVMSICFSISAYGNQNKTKVLVNGQELKSEVKLIDNKTYVHVVALSNALGAKVEWDANNSTVIVSSQTNDELIPEIIKLASPSVVGIIGNWKSNAASSNKYSEDLIHGTGVIVKSNGEILTNAHVVKEMDKIIAVLSNGKGYEAKLKYIDEESDLAVVKINKSGLSAAIFGNQEDIITGKTVIAIGTPVSFSLRNSASIGIISGVNRSVDSTYRLIQTDAAINPGNSGGPLVNLKGEVIGINSLKYSSAGIEGLCFAIPLGTVQYVMEHFELYGRVKRPHLGAVFEEDWAARLGLPSENGLRISEVAKNSPAQTHGLKVDDTLISINNVKINTIIDYNEEMKKYLPKSKATFKVKRNNSEQNFSIVFGEK